MRSDRNDPFVPLSATPLDGRRPDWQVTVLKPTDVPTPFRPLRDAQATVTTGIPPVAKPPVPACEPRVTVEREGDFVSAIRVHCTCGQTIELACVYEARPAQS